MSVEVSVDVYGEGYWERGEGSNYRGYGDDPGWVPLAKALRLHLQEGGTVVELGCASGYFVRQARAEGLKCVGVDLSEYAVGNCPPEVRAYVSVAAATDIARARPGKLDAVLSWEMLEHLTEPEILTTVEGIWNALAPGGLMWHKIALDTDGDPDWEHIPFHDAHGDATHVSLWKPDRWRELFRMYGFRHAPHTENLLNNEFRGRDWFNRFFCYRKPMPGEVLAGSKNGRVL